MKKSYIKGFLEDIILHLIAERGESYGYELTRLVEEKTEGIIKLNEGALYPVLHKLENEGLLVSEFRSQGSRHRKYYHLGTKPEAKVRLEEMAESVKSYVAALNGLFGT
jgi:PadR family transcriptional regulator PadR